MKIVNVQAQPIEACCCFKYRGMYISASTILSPPCSIHVYPMGLNSDKCIYDATTVEDAIKWVDNYYNQGEIE